MSANAQMIEPWLAEALKKIAARAESISGETYRPYTGSRIAPLPPELQQAYKMATDIGSYTPDINRARHEVMATMQDFPSAYGRYANPHQQEVLNRIREEGMRGFKETLPQLENTFIRRGQHGSSRHRQLSQQMANEMQSNVLRQQTDAMARNYEQAAKIHGEDMLRRQAAAGQLGTLGQLSQAGRITDIAALSEVGRHQQAMANEELKNRWEQYLRETHYPEERLMAQSAILRGFPYSTLNSQLQQSQMQPQMNTLGQLGSLAGQLLGARMSRG